MDDLGYLADPGDRMGHAGRAGVSSRTVVIDIGMHLQLEIPRDNPLGFRPGERWTPDLGYEFLRAHCRMETDVRASRSTVTSAGRVRHRRTRSVNGSGSRRARMRARQGASFDLAGSMRRHSISVHSGSTRFAQRSPGSEAPMPRPRLGLPGQAAYAPRGRTGPGGRRLRRRRGQDHRRRRPELVAALAEAKAGAVAGELARPRAVIGCDSMLELDGRASANRTPDVATARWRAMRGRDPAYCIPATVCRRQAQAPSGDGSPRPLSLRRHRRRRDRRVRRHRRAAARRRRVHRRRPRRCVRHGLTGDPTTWSGSAFPCSGGCSSSRPPLDRLWTSTPTPTPTTRPWRRRTTRPAAARPRASAACLASNSLLPAGGRVLELAVGTGSVGA